MNLLNLIFSKIYNPCVAYIYIYSIIIFILTNMTNLHRIIEPLPQTRIPNPFIFAT